MEPYNKEKEVDSERKQKVIACLDMVSSMCKDAIYNYSHVHAYAMPIDILVLSCIALIIPKLFTQQMY